MSRKRVYTKVNWDKSAGVPAIRIPFPGKKQLVYHRLRVLCEEMGCSQTRLAESILNDWVALKDYQKKEKKNKLEPVKAGN